MKIAIVHDYIKEYGGAERVLEEFIKIFPNADVYTSVYHPQYLGPHKKRFKNLQIHTSFLQYIPFSAKLISPLRLLAPIAFKSFNLSSYDIVLVSQTGAYFPNMIRKGGAKLICYTHTPPRYLYGYMTARDWKNNPLKRVVGHLMVHFLRIVDYHASKNVDVFISNSQEVSSRIKKYYRRDSIVIYPPVATNSVKNTPQDFYLTGGRLALAKGVDIILDAFIKNGRPLKIFGKGFAGFEEKLLEKMRNKKGNEKTRIEFLGEVDDSEKHELMKNAKAFIFASFDEDFGITPVEAMGAGTPVIAFKSGGVKETVIEGKTGVFYEPNTPSRLTSAIEKFEKLKIRAADCRTQAQKFSPEAFDDKIKEIVTHA